MTQEPSVFKTRQHPEYPFLLGVAQVCLEPDKVIHCLRLVLGTKLDHRERPAARRVPESGGAQRPESKRAFSAARNLFYRETSLEVFAIFVSLVKGVRFGRDKSSIER